MEVEKQSLGHSLTEEWWRVGGRDNAEQTEEREEGRGEGGREKSGGGRHSEEKEVERTWRRGESSVRRD